MKILVIDPGLDQVGFAIFATPDRRPITPRDFRACLVASGSFASTDGAPLPRRLFELHRGLGTVLLDHRPDIAFLELPATPGNYSRNDDATKGRGFMAGTMEGANRATGALLLALQLMGIRTETIAASSMEKKKKSEWVVNIWPELGNRKSNADQRDAIHLGGVIILRPHLWADNAVAL